MLPVTPGELMKVEFALNPVAARLNPGERVRLAIAGTDTAYFRRYSEGKPEAFTISFGPQTPSAYKAKWQGQQEHDGSRE